MFSHRFVGLLIVVALGSWAALDCRPLFGDEPGGPPFQRREDCRNCPHRGVRAVGETIRGVGSQECPRVTIGFHIPFIGEVSIKAVGGACPLELERTDAHNEETNRLCYRIVSNTVDPTYDISRKTVTCVQSLNLIVVALKTCNYDAPWMVQTQRRNPEETMCNMIGEGGGE